MHILVATDADHVVNDVTAALSAPDVSFTVCREGREVSRLVAERSPDVVVLDLMLPVIDGQEVCKRLRADPATRDTLIMMLIVATTGLALYLWSAGQIGIGAVVGVALGLLAMRVFRRIPDQIAAFVPVLSMATAALARRKLVGWNQNGRGARSGSRQQLLNHAARNRRMVHQANDRARDGLAGQSSQRGLQ